MTQSVGKKANPVMCMSVPAPEQNGGPLCISISESSPIHCVVPGGDVGDAALVKHVKERARAWVESQAGGGDE